MNPETDDVGAEWCDVAGLDRVGDREGLRDLDGGGRAVTRELEGGDTTEERGRVLEDVGADGASYDGPIVGGVGNGKGLEFSVRDEGGTVGSTEVGSSARAFTTPVECSIGTGGAANDRELFRAFLGIAGLTVGGASEGEGFRGDTELRDETGVGGVVGEVAAGSILPAEDERGNELSGADVSTVGGGRAEGHYVPENGLGIGEHVLDEFGKDRAWRGLTDVVAERELTGTEGLVGEAGVESSGRALSRTD